MGKVMLAGVAGIVIGALGGALAVQTWFEPRMVEMEAELAAAREEVRLAVKKADASEERAASLRAEVYALENERAELLARLRGLETGAGEIDSVAEFDEFFVEDAAYDDWEDTPEDGEDDADDRRADRWGSDAERRRAFAERRARMAEFRAEVDAQVEQQIAALGPDYANHFGALVDNRAYREEVLGALRAAESDEEREALLSELRLVGEENRALMREVQDGLIRAFAEARQGEDVRTGAYARDLRALLASPIFEMEGMYVGERRGRGGFGGRRGWGR